jgi:hypothetical protein
VPIVGCEDEALITAKFNHEFEWERLIKKLSLLRQVEAAEQGADLANGSGR